MKRRTPETEGNPDNNPDEQSHLEEAPVAKEKKGGIGRSAEDSRRRDYRMPSQMQLKTKSSPLSRFIKDGLFAPDTDEESMKYAIQLLYDSLKSEHTLNAIRVAQLSSLQALVESIKNLGGHVHQVEIKEPLDLDLLNYLLDKEFLEIGVGLYLKFPGVVGAHNASLQQINALLVKSGKCVNVQINNAMLDFINTSETSSIALFANVTRLSLVNVRFTPQAVLCLTTYLNATQILTNLSIIHAKGDSCDSSGDILGTNLALILGSNTKLKQLSFSGSGVYWPTRLAQALTINSTLQILDLHDNKLSFASLGDLSQALERNKGLTYLCLSHCAASSGYPLVKLGRALAKNCTLTSLSLAGNALNGKSIRGLQSILNANLKILDITDNSNLVTDDKSGSLRAALLTAKLTSLSVDKDAFINADEDSDILQFMYNRSLNHFALVHNDSNCNEISALEALAERRNFNLMKLSTKFTAAVLRRNYNFNSMGNNRLYYFEQALLGMLGGTDKVMLYIYNRFLALPACTEILLCAHDINHNGVRIEREIIGKIAEYLREVEASIYQKCSKTHYNQIKQREFRDVR